jgi:SAM-dependent methyltransferase
MAPISEPPHLFPRETLSGRDYLRQRMQPSLRDLNYLHLTDLGQLLRQVGSQSKGEVFDYGCGGAPYRSLFEHCKRYMAADIQPGPSVDRVLQADGTTGEEDASYDVVLSTQVLEHIKEPEAYLRECHRILRPGGQLILTTHGMFEEHGCPYDFHRWTSRGLEELVLKSGLKVVDSKKLTTEMRAFAQLKHQMILHFRCPEKPLLHVLLAITRKVYCAVGVPCLNWFAERFPHQAIVPASDAASLYVCVYVRAVKN